MSSYYLQKNKVKIKLQTKPFASGGEGELYQIVDKKYQHYVAKLYHPSKRTAEREKKINYLLQNPPIALEETTALIWVVDVLYDEKDNFMGFMMPMVKGEKLEILCLGKVSKRLPSVWQRFDFRNKDAQNYRLRLCFNLAVAIYQVHRTNSYVLVDLKPDNIIIQPDGLLSIVDMDSVEVMDEDGDVIFSAPVATPEYTPPEYYTSDKKLDMVSMSWDRFGMAVIFYKLLFGIHPFAASAKAPYHNLVSLHQKIEQGLFAHHPNTELLQVVPPPHRQFSNLSPALQSLFIDCFVAGHEYPDARPDAQTWCLALLEAIGDIQLEEHFAHITLGDLESEDKLPLPSTLLRKVEKQLVLKHWINQEIMAATSVVPLPDHIRQQNLTLATKTGKYGIKDYAALAAPMLLVGAIIYYFFPQVLPWLQHDFWLQSKLIINLWIVAVLGIVLIVLPPLWSWIKLKTDKQLKKVAIWKDLQGIYTTTQQQAKRMSNQLYQQLHPKEVSEETIILKETKETLAAQDKEVRAILKARKKMLTELQAEFVKKANQIKGLEKIKVKRVGLLLRQLSNYREKQWEVRKKYYLNSDKDIAQKEKELRAVLQQKLQVIQTTITNKGEKLKEVYELVNDVAGFVAKYANNNLVLAGILKTRHIYSLATLKTVRKDNDNYVLIEFSDREPLLIGKSFHSNLDELHRGFLEVLEAIEHVEKGTLNDRKTDKKRRQANETMTRELSIYQDKILSIYKKDWDKETAIIKAKLEVLLDEENIAKQAIDPIGQQRHQTIIDQAQKELAIATTKIEAINKKQKIAVKDIIRQATQKNNIALQNQSIKEKIKILDKLSK